MATFNETRAPTSRKYVSEQVIMMPKRSKNLQTFRLRSFALGLGKQPKILHFYCFFYLKWIIWWLLSMKRVHTLQEYMYLTNL